MFLNPFCLTVNTTELNHIEIFIHFPGGALGLSMEIHKSH